MRVARQGFHTALVAYHVALGLIQFSLPRTIDGISDEQMQSAEEPDAVTAIMTVLAKTTGIIQFGVAAIFVSLGSESLHLSLVLQVLLLVGHLDWGGSAVPSENGGLGDRFQTGKVELLESRSQVLALFVTLVTLFGVIFFESKPNSSGKVLPSRTPKLLQSTLETRRKLDTPASLRKLHRRSLSASQVGSNSQIKHISNADVLLADETVEQSPNSIWKQSGMNPELSPISSKQSLAGTDTGSMVSPIVEDGVINKALLLLVSVCHLLIGCAILIDGKLLAWPHAQQFSDFELKVFLANSKQLGTLVIAMACAIPLVPKSRRSAILVTVVLARATHAWIDYFEGPVVLLNEVHPSVGVNIALATVALVTVLYEQVHASQYELQLFHHYSTRTQQQTYHDVSLLDKDD